MEEEQGYAVMVDAASCHAASALLQLGQGNEKKISIDKQHDEQENLVAELAGIQQNQALAISNSPMPVVIDNTSKTNQDQLQVNQQQVTDPLALTVTTGSNINRLPESHKVIDQRHAISKFIADGLRQLIVNQSNDASNKIMGSLNISNSLIHISQHFHIGAGQSTEVIVDSLNLEQNSMLVNQERAQEYNSQITNNLAIVPAKPLPQSTMTEYRRK